MPASSPDEVYLELEVAAPAARVWRLLVGTEERPTWWSNLELEPRLGGAVVERWRDSTGRAVTTSGEIRAIEPQRLLRCTWRDEDWRAATEVELTLVPAGEATLIRLRHAGWEGLDRADELRRAHEDGWRLHLGDLKAAAER